ncbi:hypothetical protein VKT23_003966 [Stygiomarasmius scandens]|uniref:Uncharacterized protein n=1 Tax=Marasmiellus scandens TaxID=2682957 RepID=A0ABR1JSN9_9AGAR
MSHQPSTSTPRPNCLKQWASAPNVPSSRPPKQVGRQSSLKLTKANVHIPIPPSLLQSPHLNPESIFQKVASAPSTPSEADERWLQDTVPLTWTKNTDGDDPSGSLQATAHHPNLSTNDSSAWPKLIWRMRMYHPDRYN